MHLSPTAQRLVDAWGPLTLDWHNPIDARVVLLECWGGRWCAYFLEAGAHLPSAIQSYFRSRPSEAIKAAWARKSGVSQRRQA